MAKRKDIIKGFHAIEEALDSGHQLKKVLIQRGLKSETLAKLIIEFKRLSINIQYVPKEKLNKLSGNNQGIIALSSPIEFIDLKELIPFLYEQGETPLIAILDRISDVRNFGAIVRSAEFLGINGILIPEKGSAEINDIAIKTSSGALLKMNVCMEKNLVESCKFLKESGLQIVSASEKANISLSEIDFLLPTAIILGAEDTGISSGLLNISDKTTLIPKKGSLDSLNVSVAAGIFFYEASKGRGIES